MKKIKLIGAVLSREDMKAINGGRTTTDPKTVCITSCIAGYVSTCLTVSGTNSTFCNNQANSYCSSWCNVPVQ